MSKADQHDQVSKMTPEIAAKNKRLAIILALVAIGFYVGFILMQLF